MTTTSPTKSKSTRQRRSSRVRKPTKFDDEENDDSLQKTCDDEMNHEDDEEDISGEDEDEMMISSSDEIPMMSSGNSSATKETTIVDNGEIDWKDEHKLWDLTVAKLRDELRRRSEYVAGSKRQLINRILGKDPMCKKYRLHPENVAVEDEAEKLRRKYANGDNVSDDDDEPLEGPKGDASLWSNKQLKYKLKTLGYSTAGKRTTLLKRFRSVMHIQRQKELATGDIIDDPVNQEVIPAAKQKIFVEPDICKSNTLKRKRDSKEEETEAEQAKAESKSEERSEDVKPQTKRRKVVRRMSSEPKVSEIQTPQEDEMEKAEEVDEAEEEHKSEEEEEQILPERQPRHSQYTLSELDLCVSSSLINVYNPELAYHEFLTDEDWEMLDKEARELEATSKSLIKDKNLASHIDNKTKDVKTIEIYYSQNQQQSKVGSSSSAQVRRARKRKGVSMQVHQYDYSLVTSLDGLQSFPSLKRIVCLGQLITDISPLANCVNLEEIVLSHNLIKTIPALGKLKKLRALGLGFNQISDISPLKECSNLKYLNLSFNNTIQDISPIANCSNLIELDLSGNSIANKQMRQFLEFNSDLLVLKLHCNDISSVRTIGKKFKNLQSLYLSNNHVYDVSPLIYLRKLNELDLQQNAQLYHSLQVYNTSQLRQKILREEKQRELRNRRTKSRGRATGIVPSSTAMEEDEISLLTGSIYDTIVAAEQEEEQGHVTEESEALRTWIHYGKVNLEVLECLVQWGTTVLVGNDE